MTNYFLSDLPFQCYLLFSVLAYAMISLEGEVMYKKLGVFLVCFAILLLMSGLVYLAFGCGFSFIPQFFQKPDMRAVLYYLNEKYHADYSSSNIEFVTSYCLKSGSTGFVYTEPCHGRHITDYIYRVSNQDFEFYVKEVRHSSSKIKLTKKVDKETQSEGFYDTYLSAIMKEKLEKKLLKQFKTIFPSITFIEVYDGLGVENPTISNLYQYLGKNFQALTNTDISLESFITYLPSIATDIHVHIKIPKDISNDNFQSMVSQLVEIVQNSVVPSGINMQQVLLEFNNQLYLDYSSDVVRLEKGDNIYFSNSKVYPLDIVVSNSISQGDISYQEFMGLPKNSFFIEY